MRIFLSFLLALSLSLQSRAYPRAGQPQDPLIKAESLDSLLEQAPAYNLGRMLITDSGMKYIVPVSENIRNTIYVFFSDTGYKCIYDLQSYYENNWETTRRFILGEKGVVNSEKRFGADFSGGHLTINYKVVSGYSLRSIEFDNVYGLDEVYKVFEILDNLKGYPEKCKTVSFKNTPVIPITFIMGDARISYFIVASDSQKEVDRISFMRYDPKRNKLTKLVQMISGSLSLTHNILWILTDNAVEYLKSMIEQ